MDQPVNNSNEPKDMKLGSGEKEEDFYRDLDKKSLHQSCCTCQTLAIFFVGVLLIFSGAVFFLYWQVTHGGGVRFSLGQVATVKDFEQKITDVQTNAMGNYQLVLSTDELNTVLTEGLSIQDFILKDTTSSINPNEVLIYGNLIKPFNSKIVMATVPKAENGKLVLAVSKITAGSVNLPTLFNKKASDSLNALMDKKMIVFYAKVKVTEVTLGENEIILTGVAK